MELLLQFILLCLGFAMLGKGSDWFVDGAAGIASRFGISELIIGLTIVAMGTSAPEAAVSIAASFSGSAGITVGNIVGSNIMNILVILGLTAVIKALPVEKGTLMVEMPIVIGITVALYFMGLDGMLTLMDGAILVAIFVAYLSYLYISAKQNMDIDEDEEHGYSLTHDICYMLGGATVILIGSNVTVDAAVAMAKFFGVSDRIIGLTIVALGTSLPELFTSVTAARKGRVGIAVGNIVGSNLFNILFVIGISSMLIPIPFAKEFMLDMYWCIGAAVMLFVFSFTKRTVERWEGLIMLAAYGTYLFMMW
ncbi:MAG: calcium/sodium antiporter [Phascolarctobacterium sp.]|nr:calcium/sodium antiporter [Phascolarctobacterium sp.]